MEGLRIGSTAAGAEEPCPAVPALFLVQHMVVGKLLLNLPVEGAVQYAAHPVAFTANKLVAGINVSIRGHGHVFVAGAAAGEPLPQAGAASQVDHEVEEVEPLAVGTAIQIDLRQPVILRLDGRQIFFLQGIFLAWIGHHRLNGQLLEAFICQIKHIVAEVLVVAGEGAPNVVLLVPTLFGKFLGFFHNQLIAALAVDGRTHPVVHFRPAVDGDDHIAHFLVQEIHDFIVHQHTVGGDGELELLVLFLFDGAAVFHQPLHHREIHQRFAAEEVHFQVLPLAALFHQPVQGSLAHFIGQQLPLAHAKIAGGGKAVLAAQVAVVGGMEAQCLDHAGLIQLYVCIIIRGIQGAQLFQLTHLADDLLQLICIVLFLQLCHDLLRGVIVPQVQHIVSHIIQRMHGAAAYIQHHGLPNSLERMNQVGSSSWYQGETVFVSRGLQKGNNAIKKGGLNLSVLS